MNGATKRGFCLVMGLVAAGLCACSSTTPAKAPFSCEAKGGCPGDQSPSAQDVQDCNAALAGACGAQFRALDQCFADNEKCDGNGQFDAPATLAYCRAQNDAVARCEASGVDAGSGGG